MQKQAHSKRQAPQLQRNIFSPTNNATSKNKELTGAKKSEQLFTESSNERVPVLNPGDARFSQTTKKSSIFASQSGGPQSITLGQESPNYTHIAASETQQMMKVQINTQNSQQKIKQSGAQTMNESYAAVTPRVFGMKDYQHYQNNDNARKSVMMKHRAENSQPATIPGQYRGANIMQFNKNDEEVSSSVFSKKGATSNFQQLQIKAPLVITPVQSNYITTKEYPNRPLVVEQHERSRRESPNQDLGSLINIQHNAGAQNDIAKPLGIQQLVSMMNNEVYAWDVPHDQVKNFNSPDSIELQSLMQQNQMRQIEPVTMSLVPQPQQSFDQKFTNFQNKKHPPYSRQDFSNKKNYRDQPRVQVAAPVIPNPIKGISGAVDLNSVLSARIQCPVRTPRTQQVKQTSVTSFGRRAPSLPIRNPALQHFNTDYVENIGGRSMSTVHSSRVPDNLQEFLQPASKHPNNELIKKIRKGATLDAQRKDVDLEMRRRAQRIYSRQPTDKSSKKTLATNQEEAPSVSSSVVALRQEREARLNRQHSYCPDEDSDNDIITLLQNCPPGMRPPQPKPNDPRQLHTWRQVVRIKDSYIKRMKDTQTKSPFQPPFQPDQTAITSPLQQNILQHMMNNSKEAASPGLTSIGRADSHSLVADELSRTMKSRRKSELPRRPFRPKMSVDFCKWVEKEQNEDPRLVQHIETVLKPESARRFSEQQNVEQMSLAVRNYQEKMNPRKLLKLSNAKMWHQLSLGLGVKPKTTQEARQKPVTPISSPKTDVRYSPMPRSHMLETNRGNETNREKTQASMGTQRRAMVSVLDQQSRQQDENRIALLLNQQKQMSDLPNSESHSPRQSIKSPISGIRQSIKSPDRQSIISPKSGTRQSIVSPNRQSIISPKSGDRQSIKSPISGIRQSIKSPMSGTRQSMISPMSGTTTSNQQKNSSSGYTETTITSSNGRDPSDLIVSTSSGMPVNKYEHQMTRQMYNQSTLVSHFRRLKVFNQCQYVLKNINQPQVKGWTKKQQTALTTLQSFLGLYWKKKYFSKCRNKPSQQALKSSEQEARETVIQRLAQMIQYVNRLEDLIKLHSTGRTKMIEETVSEAQTQMKPRDTDDVTYSIMRDVIMKKLQEATDEISQQHEEKMQRVQEIIDQYGSVEAYQTHLEEMKTQHADVMANARQKEVDRKAHEEEERKKMNAKHSLENQLKVARWLGNYENKKQEIMQDEIDILAEMQEEETLAALTLMQDDAMEEYQNFSAAKEELNSLILQISSDVKNIKRDLKQTKSQKSGKLNKSQLAASSQMHLSAASFDVDSASEGRSNSISSNSSQQELKSRASARKKKSMAAMNLNVSHYIRKADVSSSSSSVSDRKSRSRKKKRRKSRGNDRTIEEDKKQQNLLGAEMTFGTNKNQQNLLGADLNIEARQQNQLGSNPNIEASQRQQNQDGADTNIGSNIKLPLQDLNEIYDNRNQNIGRDDDTRNFDTINSEGRDRSLRISMSQDKTSFNENLEHDDDDPQAYRSSDDDQSDQDSDSNSKTTQRSSISAGEMRRQLAAKEKLLLQKRRKKMHKNRLKYIQRELVQDVQNMQDRLLKLQDLMDSEGCIDAILSDYDPSKMNKKKDACFGQDFNAQQQLTSKLDKILDKTKPGVSWDDEEEEHIQKQEREKMQRRASTYSRSTEANEVKSILVRKQIPMAIEVFENICTESNERVPTIFKSVKNGNFELKEITLTQVQAIALTKAALHFTNYINKVRLDNNNLMDHDLSNFIIALQDVEGLSKLVIARNNVGIQTLTSLENLLQKRYPNNLNELGFEGIQLKPQLVKGLMNTLTSSSLRKLSLSEMNLNEESFNTFVNYLRKCQLEELEIRDSRVTAIQFLVMLDVLKNNKSLRFLNLSHNNLVTHVQSKINFGNLGGLESIAEEDDNSEKSAVIDLSSGLNEQQATLIDCISKFIRRNKQLIHLNLEDTGLTYPMLLELLKVIKKAGNLQAIHLCGNPGLTEIQLIHNTVKLLNPVNFSDWSNFGNAMKKKIAKNPQVRPLNNQNKFSQQTLHNASQPRIMSMMQKTESTPKNQTAMLINPVNKSNAVTPRARGGILKMPTSFGDEMESKQNDLSGPNINVLSPTNPSNSDSDSDSLESMTNKSKNVSMVDLLKSGLRSQRQEESHTMLRSNSIQSNRLQVYNMERTGKKSVSFQIIKDSVQLMNYKKFILSRFVGHKQTMEHGHRWRLYLESADPNACCWICENWNYTLFFWSRKFGERDQIKMTSQQLSELNEKSRCMEVYMPGEMPLRGKKKEAPPLTRRMSQNFDRQGFPISPLSPDRQRPSKLALMTRQPTYQEREMKQQEAPFLSGSFNGWEEPARMISVREFAHFIDRKKPELFNFLKKQGLISKPPTKYQELNEDEKKEYIKHLPEFKQKYEPELWKEKIAKLLKYRRANIVNAFEMDILMSSDVWVTAAFVKPGNHTYIVADYRNRKSMHSNLHECNIDPRVDAILPYERIIKMKEGDDFIRWKTIFGPWPNENDLMFRQCIEHDIKFWKVPRLIKDIDDYEAMTKVLVRHAKTLVHLFLYLASKSQFPAIGLIDFGTFCQESHIIDNKLSQGQVDLQFKAATSMNPNLVVDEKMKKMRQQASKSEALRLMPDQGLIRYQFLEILVRLAGAKYRGHNYTAFKNSPPEKINTFERAVELIITENIMQQFDFETPESIRFNKLWKTDVAAILRTNQGLLNELLQYCQKKKKYMSFEACYSMMERVQKPEQQIQSGISLKEFTFIYGMSKMIIPEESHQGLKYVRSNFLEVIEMISRLTILKNFNTQLEDLPLYKQIQLTMDEILERHLGYLTFDIGAGDSDQSSGESEDDY